MLDKLSYTKCCRELYQHELQYKLYWLHECLLFLKG
jgi:hypothetical protein